MLTAGAGPKKESFPDIFKTLTRKWPTADKVKIFSGKIWSKVKTCIFGALKVNRKT